MLERYDGATLWADTAQTEEVAKRVAISDTFEPGERLTDLPIDLLLLTHGGAVEHGRDALRTALAAWDGPAP